MSIALLSSTERPLSVGARDDPLNSESKNAVANAWRWTSRSCRRRRRGAPAVAPRVFARPGPEDWAGEHLLKPVGERRAPPRSPTYAYDLRRKLERRLGRPLHRLRELVPADQRQGRRNAHCRDEHSGHQGAL